MAQTLIRGSTQIQAGTVAWDRMASGAIVPTASLADGANFLKRDGSIALTAAFNAGNQIIGSVADAVASQDAVNLRTLQSYVNGIAIKPAVRGVQTANQALTGTPTVDGVTYVATDVILLTAQTTASQNGPWVVAAGAWSRPSWWAAASTQKPALFFVMEGTTFHDTKWTTITDGAITVDTTSVTISQDTSGGTYTNGNGISLTGNVFAVKTGNGIAFDGSNNVSVTGDAARLVTTLAGGVGITDGTPGQIVVANGSNHAAWVTASGDATVSSAGAITVNNTSGSGFVKFGNYVFNETPSGTINGSNTAFTLAFTPVSSSLSLFLNGILLEPGAGNDYTISGAAITMLFGPTTGDKLRAAYLK